MASALDFLLSKLSAVGLSKAPDSHCKSADEPRKRRPLPLPRRPSDVSATCTEDMSEVGAEALRPDDFEVAHRLGKGSYASVYLARHRDTHEWCALKAVSKRKVSRDAADLRHLWSEKEVNELLDSPFVVGSHGTFQDKDYVYMALDHMPGGDLYRRMRKAGGRLPLAHCRFYVAGTVLAIQHVHRRGCVHRDIKPENILLDADGYPKLIDFGFGRKLAKGEQLLSMFGTPEYVAPEVLLGQGHAHAADLWSLGVLIYELLVGSTPWCATSNGGFATPPSTEHVYERITSGDVYFPPDMDRCAKDLILQLLHQDPRKRLGVVGRGGSEGLRAHKFFRSVDWAALNARRAAAPHVPSTGARQAQKENAAFNPLVQGDERKGQDEYGGMFDGF